MLIDGLKLREGSVNANIVIPAMTLAECNALPKPDTGELSYITDINPGLYIYNGTVWYPVGGSPISSGNGGGDLNPIDGGGGGGITPTTYLTTNENITISGDATGSGNTAITLTLADSGVFTGTYKSVTVDSKGRVTNGTNPTTLTDYGITDAQTTLVSGSNIKTINGNSILGSGDIIVSGLKPTSIKNTNYTAVANDLVRCNTSTGAFSVTLPEFPNDGDLIGILDVYDSFGINHLTIIPNGHNVDGGNVPIILNDNGAYLTFMYIAASDNWKRQGQLTAQSTTGGSTPTAIYSTRTILSGDTSTTSPTTLTVDLLSASTNNQVILPNNSAFMFTINVTARQSASLGTQAAAWKIEGLIRRESNASTTTLVSSNSTTISNVPGWSVNVQADTVNGGLAVNVAGSATNIKWVAIVNTTEVVNI